MRETLPQEAVLKPAPVQSRAVPILVNKAEETPKEVEVTLSLFLKAKFDELSSELAG